jgi:hypothetical protein
MPNDAPDRALPAPLRADEQQHLLKVRPHREQIANPFLQRLL